MTDARVKQRAKQERVLHRGLFLYGLTIIYGAYTFVTWATHPLGSRILLAGTMGGVLSYATSMIVKGLRRDE